MSESHGGWRMYGRPPKRFPFLYSLGKNSKEYTKLKRFIKIYLSLFHYTLNSKIWMLFTMYYPIYQQFTHPIWKCIKSNWCSKVKMDLLTTLVTFFTTFFLSNWETSAALLSCHKWEPWYDCIKNGLIHGQRGMRLIFLILPPPLPTSIPLKVSLTIRILMSL